MGKYAGSLGTRALSGAETIHVNGEVLEYLKQGNQHGYCAVHTPQCRTYAQCRMPYEICRTGARILSSMFLQPSYTGIWYLQAYRHPPIPQMDILPS